MKFMVSHLGKKLILLVDLGASHNFLPIDIMRILEVKPKYTHDFVVEVGDGHKVRNQGVCSKVELQLS